MIMVIGNPKVEGDFKKPIIKYKHTEKFVVSINEWDWQ